MKLQRTQRKMLRMILGSGRRRQAQPAASSDGSSADRSISDPDIGDDLEPWEDWLRRTTHQAEAHLERHNMATWTTAWRRKVWRWAARGAAYPRDRWAWKAAAWQPELSAHARGRLHRGQWKRWCDDIIHFLQSKDILADASSWVLCNIDWSGLEHDFCTHSE